ncbi:MAG: DUF4336 domain-containing protein [Arthrospira sp. PLM2.Bin9]|nr:DUF4336 domain-containing protein [Arthrospira sp. PLM2.Bin9]TVU52410.1 MAG: DUF4336 domain-containing protein [Arthrospira sp. PLM2.Bin9]
MESQPAHPNPLSHSSDWRWPWWPLVPLYPFSQRRTIRREVVSDRIWTFEQIQGILYVVVPIRMTVIRLDMGGLLVYAPVAPTPECIRLVNELVAEYGEVRYIILPTTSGLEHKVFVGPFARKFPQAQVFVAPEQWSYPLKLPLSWLGLPAKRTHILPADCSETPFSREFSYAILGPINLGLGTFGEVAFFHWRSQTLLLTDTIISIPEQPPAIVQLDPYPLLFHARDNAFQTVADHPITRQKGWQRITLFSLYFQPDTLDPLPLKQALSDALKASDRSRKAYFGLFPFQWRSGWEESFNTLRGDGNILVAPILQTLILNRSPQVTLAWADRVCEWNFNRIIPCHFDAPITATPQEFREAFSFLEPQEAPPQGYLGSSKHPLPAGDFTILQNIDKRLNQWGITPPPASAKMP